MLTYQLSSHERKKKYWEQLELRCRSLYAGPQPPPPQQMPVVGAPSIIGTPRGGPCRCCEQCHSHRNIMPSAYPWDGDNRFWTPAPGQSGNFYSPNPGGDEMITVTNRSINQVAMPRQARPGWSWPRLPWQRNEPQRFRQTPSSPDSQYGFSNQQISAEHQQHMQQAATQPGYTVIGGPPHYGVWGPPPPYSDPNSPARRGRYQYIHPTQCQQIIDHNGTQQSQVTILECHQHGSSTDSQSMEPFCPQQTHHRATSKRHTAFKSKETYENTPSDSDGPRDRFSNTLPVRKQKKRVEIGAKSIGPNNQSGTARINVQNVFTSSVQHHHSNESNGVGEHEYQETNGIDSSQSSANAVIVHAAPKQRRSKVGGVENSAFLSAETIEAAAADKIIEPTESEVYFADVSSCCNMSVKNDNFYDETQQRRMDKFSKEENEDYLVQRFGKREASIRSRLPFPQMIPEDYEKPAQNVCPIVTPRTSLMHKDVSRQSMCSVDSGEKTDFTDLSPATPGSGFPPSSYTIDENDEMNYQNKGYPTAGVPQNSGSTHFPNTNYKKPDFTDVTCNSNFVSAYPSYSCGTDNQSQEAHRRSTKNLQEIFLAPDAQYEMIADINQFDQTGSMNYEHHLDTVVSGGSMVDTANGSSSSSSSNSTTLPYGNNSSQSSHFHKPKSPNTLNITPIKRQNLGTNISAIIQNLGGSDSGLLYPDNRARASDILLDAQDCMLSNKSTNKMSENEWSDHSDRRL